MSLAYFMIMDKLWKGLRKEIEHDSCQKLVAQKSNSSPNLNGHVVKKTMIAYSENGNSTICEKNATKTCLNCQNEQLNNRRTLSNNRYSCLFKDFSQMPPFAEQSIKPESLRKGRSLNEENDVMKESTYTFARHGIRSNYLDRSIEAKRKVIRMLFVIVAEFFICWTPLHILNTLYVYYPDEVYKTVGSTEVSLIHLLCYVSSCSNPITYCFMNRKFRQTFFTAFRCRTPCLPDTSVSVSNFEGRPKNVALKKQSENSCNDSTLFMGRISYSGRSDPEAEDRV
ncbi:hypothetical protein ABEB36_004974 [Hypothenemus hampei]|uniref:G-protein coupled receptors family 1 profile domain-containing protein n=1 Tax=Hypothenemus hampei TaxID=57062 RepID=A0ABD1EYZ9_HYPHA